MLSNEKNEKPFYEKGAFYVVIFIVAAFIFSQFKGNDNNNSSTNSTETRQSVQANCSECGRSFDLESGFKLAGHSQTFCSKGCGQKYAFEHGIILNN